MANNTNGLGINISCVIEDSKSIETKLKQVLQNVNTKIKINDIEFDEKLVSEKLQSLLKSISSLGTEFKQSFSGIPLTELQQALSLTEKLASQKISFGGGQNLSNNIVSKDAIQYIDSLDELIKKYEELGYIVKTTSQKGFIDDKQLGKLREFTIELDKQNGVIEKMTYKRGGAGTVPFELSSLKSIDNTDKLVQQAEKEAQKLAEVEAKINKQKITDEQSYQKEIEKTISLMTKQVNTLDKNNWLPKEDVSNLRNQISRLSMNSDESQFAQVNKLLAEQVEREKEIASAIKITENNTKNFTKEQQARNKATFDGILNAEKAEQSQRNMETIASEYAQKTNIALDNLRTKYGNSIPNKELNDLKSKLESIKNLNVGGKPIESMEQLKKVINQTKIEYASLDSVTRSNAGGFLGTMAHNLSGFASFYLGAGGVITALSAIKSGINDVVQMDNALVNLNKVVDMSKQQLDDMKNSAIDLGKSLGASASDVAMGMAEFGRVYKDTASIKEMTKTAIVAQNVTDLSVEESAKSLNTAIISFKLNAQDSMKVLDSWNELQNNFRVSATDLADSIGKVGSIAKQTGLDINQLNAMTTTLVSSTGISGNEAGTAIKSSLARLYNMGEDGDGGKAQKLLANYGIEVVKLNGELVPFDNILAQLSETFKTLSTSEKLQIEQAIGGTYHYAKVAQLVENYSMVLDANKTSLDSQNSAMIENEKYLNSIEGRMKVLNTTIQEKWNNAISSDGIKGTISAVTTLIDTFANLPAVIGLATTAFLVFKGKAIMDISRIIGTFISSLGVMATAEIGVAGATGVVSSAFDKLTLAITRNPIGFVAVALTTLISVFAMFNSTVEDSTQKINELNTSLQETKQSDILIGQYEELSKKIDENTTLGKDNKENKEQLLNIQRQFAQTFKDNIDGYTAEGDAIIKNIETVKKLNEAKKQETLMTAQVEYGKLKDKYKPDISWKGQDMNSDVQQYLETQKALKKAIDNNDFKQADKMNKWLQPYREDFNNFNKNAIMLYNLGVKNVEVINLETGAFERYTPEIESNTNSLENNSNKKKDNINFSYDMAKSQKEASESFETSTTNIDFYNKALSELDKDGVLSSSTVKSIFSDHQELIGSLENEGTLRDKLTVLVKEQEKAQGDAYRKMIGNSTEYYSANIKNNGTMVNEVNNAIAGLVNSQGEAYTADFNSYKTLNEMKIDVAYKAIEKIAGYWAQFWDSASNSFDANAVANELGIAGAGEAEIVSNMESDWGNKIRDALSKLDKATYIPVNYNFTPINNNQPSSGSGSGSSGSSSDPNSPDSIQNLELKIDRYQNLNAAIDNVNNALTKNKTLQDQANDKDKLNLLNEEINLLNQKRTALNKLLREQQREKRELETQLRNAGFVVDSTTGLISNFKSRLQALQNSANAKTTKTAKQSAIDNVKKLEEAIKTYMDLVHKTMASTKNDILSISGEIKKIYEEELSAVSDVESKITDVIKKQVEERKQAIEDEKNAKIKAIEEASEAYNKANSTEDYQQNLTNEQQKLSEIQSQIADARRDQTLQGKARLKSLLDEAKAQQDVIDKMVLDRQRELNNQAFEDQKKAIEDDAEAKTKNLDDNYTDEKINQIVKQALSTGQFTDINNRIVSIKDAYIDFVNKFEDGTSALGNKIKTEFIDKLDMARNIMTSLGSIMSNLGIGNIQDVNSGIFTNASNLLSNVSLNLPQITPNITIPTPNVSTSTASQTPNIVFNQPFVTIQGNVDDSTMPKLQQAINDAIEKFKQTFKDQLQLQGIY